MRFNPDIRFDTTSRPKAHNFIDRTGERYGKLVFVNYAGRKSNQTYWNLKCDCGTEFAAYAGNVVRGLTTSCGCVHSVLSSEAATKHGDTKGLSKSSEYACWVQIKTRCHNPNYREFRYYGGRGIKVCDRWIGSFENFLSDMGRKPSPKHSIDRIDTNGNYEPGNCRWATASEQRINQRRVAR